MMGYLPTALPVALMNSCKQSVLVFYCQLYVQGQLNKTLVFITNHQVSNITVLAAHT